MLINPYLASELARVRQSEMVAHAEQQRLVRQFRDIARASRRAQRAERQTRRVLGKAWPLRAKAEY
jgi:hypothetical protein